MKKIIRLTESYLTRIVRKVIMEEEDTFMTNNYRSPNFLLHSALKRNVFPEYIVSNPSLTDFVMWSDEIPREDFYWEVSLQTRDKKTYDSRMTGDIESEIELRVNVSQKWYFDKIKPILQGAVSNTTDVYTPESHTDPRYKYAIVTSRKFTYNEKNPLGGDSKSDAIYITFRDFLSKTLNILSN